MIKEKCGNCAFALISQGQWDATQGKHAEMCYCRRYPPQVITLLMQGPNGQPVQAVQTMFPQVQLGAVCGEHLSGTPILEMPEHQETIQNS